METETALNFFARFLGALVVTTLFSFLLGILPYLFFRKRFRGAGIIVFGLCFFSSGSFLLFGSESVVTDVAATILMAVYLAPIIQKWRESQKQSPVP